MFVPLQSGSHYSNASRREGGAFSLFNPTTLIKNCSTKNKEVAVKNMLVLQGLKKIS